METFIEALFAEANISWNRNQYVTVIENGISSLKDKCNQAHNNAINIQSKILHDYNIIKNRKHRRGSGNVVHPTPMFEIQRGIATWNKYSNMKKSMKENDIFVGIAVTGFPDMPGEYFDDIRKKISKLKNNKHNIQKRLILRYIKKGQMDDLYNYISNNENDIDEETSSARGYISERTLYWLVKESAKEVAETKSNVFCNVKQMCTDLQYNNHEQIKYGFKYELDTLLHTNNKYLTSKILKNIESDSVFVYFNERAEPFRV